MSGGFVEYVDFERTSTDKSLRISLRNPGVSTQRIVERGRRIAFSSVGAMAIHMALERGFTPEEVAPLLELADREDAREHSFRMEALAWGEGYTAPQRQRELERKTRGPGSYGADGIWRPKR